MSADPRLAEAFRTALELTPETEVEALAYGQHPYWDSVGHTSAICFLASDDAGYVTAGQVLGVDGGMLL